MFAIFPASKFSPYIFEQPSIDWSALLVLSTRNAQFFIIGITGEIATTYNVDTATLVGFIVHGLAAALGERDHSRPRSLLQFLQIFLPNPQGAFMLRLNLWWM